MTKQRAATKVDEGLQQIADWHRWFVNGHTQRLKDLNLPKDQHDRELAGVTRLGAAVADRMRSDFIAWTTRHD